MISLARKCPTPGARDFVDAEGILRGISRITKSDKTFVALKGDFGSELCWLPDHALAELIVMKSFLS